MTSSSSFLPGTEVHARGLPWIVVDARPQGEQTLLRLRGQGGFAGFEFDILTPFEAVEPVSHTFDPTRAGPLANWRVYHQAFLLEQALGPEAFLAVQPGRLRVEPYQLVPLARALRMSRPRLLLADDVGLGKTIEAGLIIAELMARRRAQRLLVVTPAGPLLQQWQAEMTERFGLRLTLADRAEIDALRRGAELGANPFDYLPLAIASMDFLKQDRVLDELERSLPYDLVVMDEAHHYSETGSGDGERAEASQRRRLANVLARQSDALLLLTATPHDGYERSFASLLELLDPSLLDGKGLPRKEAYPRHVVRRLKKHIQMIHPETGETLRFPERQLEPVAVAPDGLTHPQFVELHRLLLRFTAPALKKALRSRQYDDALAYLALLKRSTSTVAALRSTLAVVHQRLSELAGARQEEQEARRQRRQSLRSLQRQMARFGVLTLDEEHERELLEQEELAQQLALVEREWNREARSAAQVESAAQTLAALLELAAQAEAQDCKLAQLVSEVQAIRQVEPKANILIYTEYVDSLRAAEAALQAAGAGPIVSIHGGAGEAGSSPPDRRSVTERFRSQEKLILISTDAAAEGLNLHERCHHLIHLELPWNPNRLEQRNGRIDRYGQWRRPVIRYLYLCGSFEERILARLMAKYERQRERLKFMPNTLGLDLAAQPEAGLFAALAAQPEMSGLPCRSIDFQEPAAGEADDPGDADLQALLLEIEKSLRHFESAARTHAWLGEQGAAADELAQRQARRALEAGRQVGGVDLAGFVSGAVQTAGGQVRANGRWQEISLPPGWAYALDGLPGWDAEHNRLRLTSELGLTQDEHGRPLGYLGRAHPLVRRASEHTRSLALGQQGGLDGRVTAARAMDGQKALLYTFLGRVESQAGREYERLLAVRVDPQGAVQVLPEGSAWLPEPGGGLATKGLWEREFAGWGEAAQSAARQAAEAAFAELAAGFSGRRSEALRQEQRDLEAWLTERVDELAGKASEQLPLFGLATGAAGAATGAAGAPLRRLQEFIGLAAKGSRPRSAAESVLRIYEARLRLLAAHNLETAARSVQPVGLLMLTTPAQRP